MLRHKDNLAHGFNVGNVTAFNSSIVDYGSCDSAVTSR
ncbi:hypothetical protein SCODD09_01391 [Streptococcus constellatus]|nr:hypothetical protein SCODD09_01391 [Streptococcus constellatus]